VQDTRPPTRERFAQAVLATAALWFSFAGEPAHAGDFYSEESVKAAFVLRFTGYVTWPSPPTPTTPFRIAVLGDHAIATRLQSLVENRSLGARPIDVRQITSLAEARDAQLLYVGARRSGDLPALLHGLRDRNVLTITDVPDGLDAGSIINLLNIDQRVRFEVSMDAARRAGLSISSELLSLAVRVQGRRAQSLPASETAP
jgi:hypothetical protein